MYIKGLEPGSPLMEGFDRLKDILFLNLLTILCCLPVVTSGAALAAMHYCALKLVRDEEGYISKMYFKAFKDNLKQGIASSIIMIFIILFIVADFYAISGLGDWINDANTELIFTTRGGAETILKTATVLLILVTALFIVTVTWYFPVMAKFEAKIRQNISNAFKFSLSHFPRTLLMIVLNAAPFVISLFLPVLSPLILFFGLSVPAYFDAKLYDKVFGRLEGR